MNMKSLIQTRLKIRTNAFRSLVLLAALLVFHSSNVLAYQLDVKQIAATNMAQSHPANIILPDSYSQSDRRYPVLYLLHGHGGDYQNWVTETAVARLADQYNIIVVTPDGNTDKWYTDSPINKQSRYRSYIAQDVVSYIDQHYRTIATPAGRAISGLSMGGYGALHIGLQHPELFGALGSTSGGVDPRGFAGKWGLNEVLGDPATHADNWQAAAIVSQIAALQQHGQLLYLDCGSDDFFIEVNRQLHQTLRTNNISHYYAEWPGSHNWDYWRASIQYQMVFFHQFFTGVAK